MYGDWRDDSVVNKYGTRVMLDCRTINSRCKLAKIVRLIRREWGFGMAVSSLAKAGYTNFAYAEKAVRDLK